MGVFPFCIHRLTPVAPAPRRLCVGVSSGRCVRTGSAGCWDWTPMRDGKAAMATKPGEWWRIFPLEFPKIWGSVNPLFFSILDDIGSCPSQWLKLPFFGEDWVNSPFFERKVRVRLSSADLKEPSLLYPESTFRNWVPVTEWVTSMFSCWTSSLLYQ